MYNEIQSFTSNSEFKRTSALDGINALQRATRSIGDLWWFYPNQFSIDPDYICQIVKTQFSFKTISLKATHSGTLQRLRFKMDLLLFGEGCTILSISPSVLIHLVSLNYNVFGWWVGARRGDEKGKWNGEGIFTRQSISTTCVRRSTGFVCIKSGSIVIKIQKEQSAFRVDNFGIWLERNQTPNVLT